MRNKRQKVKLMKTKKEKEEMKRKKEKKKRGLKQKGQFSRCGLAVISPHEESSSARAPSSLQLVADIPNCDPLHLSGGLRGGISCVGSQLGVSATS